MRSFALSILLLFAAPLGVGIAAADTTVEVDAGVGAGSLADAGAGSAAAPAPATPADPVAKAKASVDTGWDLVEDYGPIWGGMLLAFAVVSALLRKNAEEHWLKEGRKLALMVAGVGVLGSVLEAHFGSGSWAGVVVTAIAAVKMLTSPTVPPPRTAPPAPAAGAIDLFIVFLVIGAVLSSTGCGAWSKRESNAVAGDVVDCTKKEATAAIATFGPTLADVLVTATAGDGSIDKDRVKAATRGFATDTARCVLADTIARALNPKPTDPNAPHSSPLEADPAALHALFAELAGGKSYRTEHGTL